MHRYEGTVNKVMGDGIMALFGAPIAHEDHAMRACYAALAIQRGMEAHAEQLRRAHCVDVAARVGLHSGEVVVRAIGNDLSVDYDAIGPTVHLASRMEQLARPGAIRLSDATARLAEGWIAVEPLGAVPIKGLAEPVPAFCPPDQMGPGSPVQRLDYHGQIERLLRNDDLEGLMRYVVSRVYSESDTQDLGQSTVVRMMMIPKETLLSFYDPDPGMDIKALLSDIRVPTLIAHGTADRQVPFPAAEFLAAQVPGAVLYAFKGYGHAPQFTATQEFCNVLRKFVGTGTA